MESYFSKKKLFSDDFKILFALNYLEVGVQDWIVQWMGGTTKMDDWEAFKARVVYQFGTIEELDELFGIDMVVKEPIQVEEDHVFEEIEEKGSSQEEDLVETTKKIQDFDPNVMDEQVRVSHLETNHRLVQEIGNVGEKLNVGLSCDVLCDRQCKELQLSDVKNMESLAKKGTCVSKLGSAYQVFIERPIASENYTKKKMKLFPKSWKFRFKIKVFQRRRHKRGTSKKRFWVDGYGKNASMVMDIDLLNVGKEEDKNRHVRTKTHHQNQRSNFGYYGASDGGGLRYYPGFGVDQKDQPLLFPNQKDQIPNSVNLGLQSCYWKIKSKIVDLRREKLEEGEIESVYENEENEVETYSLAAANDYIIDKPSIIEKQEGIQGKGERGNACELLFKAALKFFYGSLLRPPEQQFRAEFGSKARACEESEQVGRCSSGDTCGLQFKLVLIFPYGSLSRPPEQ